MKIPLEFSFFFSVEIQRLLTEEAAADDIPMDWRVSFLKDTPDKTTEIIAVQSSKAVGEPPLLLGMSAYFAIREAIASSRRQSGLHSYYPMDR